jgi:hypothetical protein
VLGGQSPQVPVGGNQPVGGSLQGSIGGEALGGSQVPVGGLFKAQLAEL